MNIKPFGVERWMDLYETTCKYNIAETCVDSMSLRDLEQLVGEPGTLDSLIFNERMTYGEIPGSHKFREGVASLYKNVEPDQILSTNGAIGANFLALYTLVNPGDEVVVIVPTYQQHTSIPESLGANVKTVWLQRNKGFQPDLNELRETVTPETKLICFNNPNNPTGALIDPETMQQIVKIAREQDAWLLCDEVYRHLNHDDEYAPSVVDLYEKGISTGSMSKVFSLAGLRLGWLVAPKELIEAAYDIRHYNMISCGKIDEIIGAFALEHKDKIIARSRAILKENLEILDEWISNEPHIDYVRPKAGTTALLYYDMDLSSTELCHDLMAKEGVMLTPGDCFDMGRCLRIGYAFDPKDLRAGLEAFGRYLRKYDHTEA
ncbi:MAG: aminotransferase [Acidaminobacter sp.]|uniref:aminotransferase n=1 Tax=Acidaminobacter sp. TaxID=1872102 RepID=UPI00137C6AC7|nr:aminotransferase [Acidaminobacter sp.]MZQ96160.1 aminotransferase [Acidaminobacter sp.]